MTMLKVKGERFVPSEWIDELRKEMNIAEDFGLPIGYGDKIVEMVNNGRNPAIAR